MYYSSTAKVEKKKISDEDILDSVSKISNSAEEFKVLQTMEQHLVVGDVKTVLSYYNAFEKRGGDIPKRSLLLALYAHKRLPVSEQVDFSKKVMSSSHLSNALIKSMVLEFLYYGGEHEAYEELYSQIVSDSDVPTIYRSKAIKYSQEDIPKLSELGYRLLSKGLNPTLLVEEEVFENVMKSQNEEEKTEFVKFIDQFYTPVDLTLAKATVSYLSEGKHPEVLEDMRKVLSEHFNKDSTEFIDVGILKCYIKNYMYRKANEHIKKMRTKNISETIEKEIKALEIQMEKMKSGEWSDGDTI